MQAHMRNPGGGTAGARGDLSGWQDRREDTEAVPDRQANRGVGVMLGLASCHAASAFHAIVRASIAADLVGLEIEPAAVEAVGEIADELMARADSFGRERVSP